MLHQTPKYQKQATLLLIFLLLATWPNSSKALQTDTIIYVNIQATGLNNGTSWQNAYTNLQSALSNANANSEIWVAQGIYKPTSDPTNREASFSLKNGLELYGGFVGTETQRSQRNWQQYNTILSGDIDNNDQHINGVVINTTALVGNNSYHVLIADNLDSSTIIDGFIITAGQANLTTMPHERGAALYNINNSQATITNNTFSGNYAGFGGAIFNEKSNPTISSSNFSGNSAEYGGGGIFNYEGYPTIRNSNFSGNSAEQAGAILSASGKLNIYNSNFSGNSAEQAGAIYNLQSSATITHSNFSGNFVTADGGAFVNFQGDLILSNSKLSGNSATAKGGAIRNYSNSTATMTNVSISGNAAAPDKGAITNETASKITLANSIIWGNSSSITTDLPSTISIKYSLVEGCNPNNVWNTNCGINGNGNLADANPQFVNPISHTSTPTINGDLHLQQGSPAINAGNSLFNSVATDLGNNPRIVGTSIDLGAYEAQLFLEKNIVGSGTINATPQLNEYLANTNVTLSAIAKPGWSFAGWSGDLSGSNSPTNLLMDDNKSITATFSNNPPTAHAGPDQIVAAGSRVTLNGSASSDADPTQTLTYAWQQSAGTPITLSNSSAISPTFTAPNTAGQLRFSLVVTDNLGRSSTPSNVTITVGPSNAPSYTIALPFIRK